MTKKEMTDAIMGALPQSENGKAISRLQVECVIEAFSDVTAAELLGGGDISIQGVGKLKVKPTKARIGINPRTGERIDVPASRKVSFIPFSNFKEALKG